MKYGYNKKDLVNSNKVRNRIASSEFSKYLPCIPPTAIIPLTIPIDVLGVVR